MKMNIKRLFRSFLSAAVLAASFTLSGCNFFSAPAIETALGGNDLIAPAMTTTVETEPPELLPSEASEVKIGFVYNDYVVESTLDAPFEVARTEVEKALGTDTCYMEGVLVQDFPDAVDMLKEEGCNVIVACSQAFANSCVKLAREDYETYFISYGGSDTNANLASLEAELFQPVNIMGLIAAYNSESGIIGMVTDVSMYNCYGIANSFILGAKEITGEGTDVRLNWASSSSMSETKKAVDNLKEQGCDVIFLYQQSEYGIRYCNDLGIKVIGFAYNMPELAPDTYLSGYYYNLNNYLIDRIRLVQYRNFSGDCVKDGLRSGIVRMNELSEFCKDGTDAISDTLYDYVKSGKAAIFHGEIKDNYGNIRVDKGITLKHDEILALDWLDSAVKHIENYITPRGEESVVPSDLTIYD